MKLLIRFLSLSLVFFMTLQVSASAESLQDNLVPQDQNTKKIGEIELQYNEYPQNHYKLDTWVDTDGDWMPWNWADGAGKQIYIALMEIVNSIWNVNVLLANFTMKIVQESFELDFVSTVSDEIGMAIQNIAGFGPSGFMENGLWPLLVTFMIGLVGAWATYVGMVKRESSRAWSGLLSSIIIFVFALGFFSNASTILKGINDWSSNLQSNILAVSASIVNPGSSYSKEEGIATIRNQMFDLMIKKPYLLMQYGTTEVEEDRVNALLSIDPFLNDEERNNKVQEEVEQQKNPMMSIDGVSQRSGFVPLLFIANTIIGIFLLMVSGSIILYQMIFLALVLFAPVPLLMALIPKWQQSAIDWAMKVLHAQLMKIAIALLLTILFGISAILYRATESGDLGYLGMMLLQIICFVGIWAKRKELFNLVSTVVGNVESSTGATLQSYKQKYNQVKNTIGQAKNAIDQPNSRQGKIRNQPLASRQVGRSRIGKLSPRELAERKQLTREQLDKQKSMFLAAHPEEYELHIGTMDQETFQNYRNNYGKNAVEKANTDEKPLMNRKAEDPTANQDSIVQLDDVRRRRETGGMSNAPLAERPLLQDHSSEVAASSDREREETRAYFENRMNARHARLRNRTSDEQLNDEQRKQPTERRTVDLSTDREVSQDIINREQVNVNENRRNINDRVNRQMIRNEATERILNHVTESSHKTREINRTRKKIIPKGRVYQEM
ncbi:CD3337/EF1877 family mobilome membrane protein [Peribacillus psychrosaccharolyticus]|uniref:CD3337/EF1877 family mobilome membrane protein n=1 Tax=Peribacillus psychrosaccharolyticus TaxID=1407 RepID=UPI0002FD069F|nr:hypothetical protein [Peribacillus psychrosaccharolyticus]